MLPSAMSTSRPWGVWRMIRTGERPPLVKRLAIDSTGAESRTKMITPEVMADLVSSALADGFQVLTVRDALALGLQARPGRQLA